MRFLLGIMGIALSYVLLRYRERAGDMIGEAPWMSKIGGVQGFMMLCAALLFFWSIAFMTGTTEVFLYPLLLLLPGGPGRSGGTGGGDFIVQ